VELLGDAQHDTSEFGCWVFKQAATLMADIEPDTSYIDNNDFTHTAKYLFVGACFSPRTRSLLDDEKSVAEAQRLIDQAVSFCERSQSLGTMPLLIKGIVASNLRAWTEAGDVTGFWFKPQTLCSGPFQRLLDHARDVEAHKQGKEGKITARPMEMIQRFCSASTPAEFLEWALSQNSSLIQPDVRLVLKRLLTASLGDAGSGCSYLLAEDQKGAGPLTEGSVERVSFEFRPGIYIDVFGTLIHHDGSPNLRLAQLLKDVRQRAPSLPVYIVSDSQDEEIQQALSFLEELPEIIHKDKLERCELECLIDNCEPDPQGFRARHYCSPEHAVELVTRLLDGGLSLTAPKPAGKPG
jgi:hypothetical protein